MRTRLFSERAVPGSRVPGVNHEGIVMFQFGWSRDGDCKNRLSIISDVPEQGKGERADTAREKGLASFNSSRKGEGA